MQQVFISSTLEDLISYRQAADDALRHLNVYSLDVFQPHTPDKDLLETSLRALSQADLFIGLYATCYGELLPNEEISLTERLYQEACHLGIPRLIYITRPTEPLDYVMADQWGAMMRMFLDKLHQENPTLRYISTPPDLAEKIHFDVGRLKKQPIAHSYNRRHFIIGLLLVWCIILIIALWIGPIL